MTPATIAFVSVLSLASPWTNAQPIPVPGTDAALSVPLICESVLDQFRCSHAVIIEPSEKNQEQQAPKR